MKKSIYWLAISAFIMLVLPWLVVTFVTNDAGMIATIILFFAVNPLYFIIMGAFAGENVKTLWWIPVFSAIFFLAGAWIFFAMGQLSFIGYVLAYVVIGIVAMLISVFLKKKAQQ